MEKLFFLLVFPFFSLSACACYVRLRVFVNASTKNLHVESNDDSQLQSKPSENADPFLDEEKKEEKGMEEK